MLLEASERPAALRISGVRAWTGLLAGALLCAVCAPPAIAARPAFEAPEALRAALASEPASVRRELEALRADHEGDPAFDLLLARAALGTGELELARVALERVRFVAPRQPGLGEAFAALAAEQRRQVSAADEQARSGAGFGDYGAVDATGAAAADEAAELAAVDRTALYELDALLQARSFADAYAAALPLRTQWEGDPGFDYLYGIAALETGHPEEALFALERVLFFDPRQLRVRAQLARAHFLGGDLDQAEREFRRVLVGTPPAAVAGSIQGYLDEIVRLRTDFTPSLLARVEFATGYDDNVNSATTERAVVTPLGTFDLGENGTALRSGYTRSTLRLAYEHPLSRRRTVDVVLSGSLRHNFDQHDFDLDIYRVETGYAYQRGADRLRVALRAAAVILDSDRFQESAGVGASWQRRTGPWRLGAGLDVNAIAFPEDNDRDVTQVLLSLSATRLLVRDKLSVDLFGGSEYARRQVGDFYGRDLAGFVAAWQHAAAPGHLPYLRYRLLGARHHDLHPVFAERRRDIAQSAAAGWNWFVDDALSARAEIEYADVESTIDLFDHDRLRIETGLSYQF